MYEYKAKITRVVDGDTVDALIDCGFSIFRQERIRLYGIDAYESRTRDKEEKKKGLAAKARLKELVKEGKSLVIVRTEIDKKGKFGRLLGRLYHPLEFGQLGGLSYNEILVKEGHAVDYFGGKKK